MYVCVNVNVNVNVVVLVFGRRKVIILAFGDWKGKWNANFLHIYIMTSRDGNGKMIRYLVVPCYMVDTVLLLKIHHDKNNHGGILCVCCSARTHHDDD